MKPIAQHISPLSSAADTRIDPRRALMETSAYSIGKVLSALPGKLGGYEAERSAEIANGLIYTSNAQFGNATCLPVDQLFGHRDLSVTADGQLVQTDVQGLAEGKIPVCLAERAGATVLTNLTGSLKLPRVETSAFPTWLTENAQASSGAGAAVSVCTLIPQRLTVSFKVSTQLLKTKSTSISTDLFIKNLLLKQAASTLDAAAFNGLGYASQQPVGILNTPVNDEGGSNLSKLSSSGVTFASDGPTYAKALALLKALESNNFTDENLVYVTSPASKNILQQTPIIEGYPSFIWSAENTIAGKRALVSQNLSSGQLLLGYFPALIIGIWAVAVESNHFTYADQYLTEITLTLLADVKPLYGTAFATSTDAVAVASES